MPDTTIEPIGLPAASRGRIRSARRLLRRKDRYATGTFLAEGPQAVREALAEPGRVSDLFLTPAALDRHPELAAAHPAPALITDDDLRTLTEAVTPQGVVAVCRMELRPVPELITRAARLLVCCARISDPGNAGTVIRCADAFGADGVVLSAESVDPYNPKTVRATVGSLFHLPIGVGAEVPEVVAAARAAGLQVLAADGAGESLAALAAGGDLARPTLWLFGNEAHGLPADLVRLADRVVAVPIFGSAESLNLSTAAAVCLYASATAQNPTT
ncbi:TrmH family RNA methyltransferase [Microlunatus parietis]|uniref:TrmH family RNA methyltransferase n=1 Tax=Microlunatus parietis TaxID=682979 RepID=UPI0015CB312A|nr:RNA methyltransferase [Microlunatus parietis]